MPSPFRCQTLLRCFLLAGIFGCTMASGRDHLVTDYGATGDGVTLNTLPLQRAIDQAHAAGGGRVVLPSGRFLTGTIHLRTGVTLHLARGCVLLGSPRLADYERGYWPGLVLARGQHAIAIEGEGEIDGQGPEVAADSRRIFHAGRLLDFFPGLRPGERIFAGSGTGIDLWIDPHAMQAAGTLAARVAPRSRDDVATWRVDEFVRPQLIEFWECRDVRVEDVRLRNAANWVQAYRDCDDVSIRRIRVESTSYWNNDGLDLANCRRVRVTDCDINAADDGICLKTHPAGDSRPCEDITIERCRIRSSASAVKLGTASHTDFRRIRVEDLEVHDTYRSVVALESVDGGALEDITVRRVKARNTGNAFFLRVGARVPGRPPGRIRNVVLSDFDVEIPSGRPDTGYAHAGPPLKIPTNLIPASIVGLPDSVIRQVTLRNMRLTYGGGADRARAELPWTNLERIPDLRSDYPEFSMFGELPAWGIFLRHAQGVRMEGVALRLAGPDFRPALVADRISDLDLSGLRVESHGEEPVIVLADVTGERVDGLQLPVHAPHRIVQTASGAVLP
ncbi:MAG: glycoside hydrolase family 28 protein [Opitutaceae bacterium]|nr:glycoside hydrolase family 28 protein [Opitutaceae bacterium]